MCARRAGFNRVANVVTRRLPRTGTTDFADTYYDTERYALTLRNCWLRDRSGRWQFKVGGGPAAPGGRPLTCACSLQVPAGGQGDKPERCTSYREVESEPDVLAALRPLLPAAATHAGADALVEAGVLRPFLCLHTVREKWRGSAEGLVVDLDEADSGWRIGEVEVLCDSYADVAAAQRMVAATCERILAAVGGSECGKPPAEGKVAHLLRHQVPRHWHRLVRAGVITAPPGAAEH